MTYHSYSLYFAVEMILYSRDVHGGAREIFIMPSGSGAVAAAFLGSNFKNS